MEVCTIIAKNYVAHARVLARSLAEHNPGSRLWTLIIDDFDRYIDPAEEPFEVLTPRQVGCDPFIEMALSYSVLELSTAVKPWLLRHLMAQTGRPVTYLDPDIKIYGSLAPLDELAARHGVVLIPHNSEPVPTDGRRPTQVDVMLAGVYNLGYVSVAPGGEVDRLLDWWAERLRYDCRVDPSLGFFVDQRWFDLAPGFLSDVAIVRDPEYNLAYWNLYSRRLEREGERYLVNGRDLAFFHFSGFDPDTPLRLSRHQDRIDVTRHPVLEQLLTEYAADVNAHGHARSRIWPYSYLALADGTPIDETVRMFYADFADEQRGLGVSASPFTLEGATAFRNWLSSPAPDAPPGISRALYKIHAERPDVKRAFPDIGDQLVRWAEQHGQYEIPALAWAMNGNDPSVSHVAQSAASDSIRTIDEEPFALRQRPWGVNAVGSSNAALEIAETVDLIVRALDSMGTPVAPIGAPRCAGSNVSNRGIDPSDAPFAVNVITMGPAAMFDLAGQTGGQLFAGRYSIGLWFWAIDRLPPSLLSVTLPVEELWAPSTHVASALESVTSIPVTTIPLPGDPLGAERSSRSALGLAEDHFVFCSSVDYSCGFESKNPLAVIDAFRTAFPSDETVRLVLACVHSERDSGHHAELIAAVGEDSTIEVRECEAGSKIEALTAACDCYVSLHRAVAFGRDLATAMWFGKPVIATGYSGNLDFMTADNSMLVEFGLVPVGSSADPYPAEGEWADPSLEHAASLLRSAFDDQASALRLGSKAAEDIRRTHSTNVTARFMSRRLDSIWATGRPRRNHTVTLDRPRALTYLSARLQGGTDAGNSARGARNLVRKAVLRTMRPFTAYQDAVNADVAAALNEMNEQIVRLRRDVRRERAQLLAELRRHRD